MIKAAFFDLDGTLVPSTGQYSPASREALETLRKNGIRVFAATGRSVYEFHTTGMIEGLHFDAVVSLNGQYCYDDDGIIHRHLFDKADLERLVRRAQEVPFPCMIVEDELMYLNYMNDHVRYALHEIHTPSPPIRDISDAPNREVLMAMAYLPEEETQEKVLSVLENSESTRWNKYGIDILPLGCSKRTGVEKVLEKYGLSWDEVIAFGDGENDWQMLKQAAIGVVMGNAPEFMRTGELYVTDTVEEDGVAKALRHFELI